MIEPEEATIGEALDHYKEVEQKEAQLVNSALRIAFPETGNMSSSEFKVFLNGESILELNGKLAPEGNRWHPKLEKVLNERGFGSETYLKFYPRATRRFIAFADSIGLMQKKATKLLPEWEYLLANLQARIPSTRKDICRFREQGVRQIAGYSIQDCTEDEACQRMRAVRGYFKHQAIYASAQGWSPQDFADLLLSSEKPLGLLGYDNKYIGYYFTRNAWNYLIDCYPDLGLPYWPDRTKHVSIPWEDLPASLQSGAELSLLRPGRDIKTSTRYTAKNTFTTSMGILDNEGISLSTFTADLCPKDAIRLLFQGFPREKLSGDPQLDHPRALCQRLGQDPQYRDDVLTSMRKLEGAYDGLEPIENPFISVIMEVRYAEGQYPAARNLIKEVGYINKEFLSMRGRHLEWFKSRKKEIEAKTKQRTSPYDAKKAEAFKNPELWDDLLNEAQRLATQLFSDPRKGAVQWAVDVRNILFLNMILLYPLRINHFVRMIIGKHFAPDSYRISFDAKETKNNHAIDVELPEQGRMREIRKLVDLYLDEARPLLLKGRQSPYFFVPSQQTKNAGIGIREKGFNDILIALSKRHLQHLIPPALGHLNPHLIRHIVASYQLVVKNSLTRAAQLLNDEPQTVLTYYSNVLASTRISLKAFYDDLEPENHDSK